MTGLLCVTLSDLRPNDFVLLSQTSSDVWVLVNEAAHVYNESSAVAKDTFVKRFFFPVPP